jgi:hypothetical protein
MMNRRFILYWAIPFTIAGFLAMFVCGLTEYPLLSFMAGAFCFIPNFSAILLYNKEKKEVK